MRHLLAVYVFVDRRIGRRPQRAEIGENLVLLDQLAGLLDGLGRAVGVIIGQEIDLATVNAALGIEPVVIGGLRASSRAIGRGRAAVGHGLPDLDFLVRDAWLRERGRSRDQPYRGQISRFSHASLPRACGARWADLTAARREPSSRRWRSPARPKTATVLPGRAAWASSGVGKEPWPNRNRSTSKTSRRSSP